MSPDQPYYPYGGPQDDLRPLPASRTAGRAKHPDRVIEAMNRVRRARHATRPTTEPGYCLREVRELLDIGPGAPDAIRAWEAAKTKHRTGLTRIPAGSAVFWAGGRHGHVAIAAGTPGYVFSTDILRPGFFDWVRLETITTRWGMDLLGYTLDLNGVKIR